LSQNSFIQLAFLVGSDYTNGIDGIGPVSAIEILSFFESKTKNTNIEEKLLKIKEIANSKAEVYCDMPFIKKLKSSKIGNGKSTHLIFFFKFIFVLKLNVLICN